MNKPKYNINDVVYTFNSNTNTLEYHKVTGVELVKDNLIAYTFLGCSAKYYECEVFSSKEDFINNIKIEE